MNNNLLAVVLFALAVSSAALAQDQTPPPDGPQHTFQDELLDKMAGRWKLTGTIRSQSTEHLVEAQWLLNHQFLQVHEKGAPGTGSGRRPPQASRPPRSSPGRPGPRARSPGP